MTLTEAVAEQRVLLEPVSWETYVALSEESQRAGQRCEESETEIIRCFAAEVARDR